jgi:hypothetical protein
MIVSTFLGQYDGHKYVRHPEKPNSHLIAKPYWRLQVNILTMTCQNHYRIVLLSVFHLELVQLYTIDHHGKPKINPLHL